MLENIKIPDNFNGMTKEEEIIYVSSLIRHIQMENEANSFAFELLSFNNTTDESSIIASTELERGNKMIKELLLKTNYPEVWL